MLQISQNNFKHYVSNIDSPDWIKNRKRDRGDTPFPASSYAPEWIYDNHFIMKELANEFKGKAESLEEKKSTKLLQF